MTKLKLYLVSYDSCKQKAVEALTKEERSNIYCYAVGKSKLKMITAKVKRINEWDLPWHDNRYQFLQYYEYGTLPHLYKNPELTEGLTHVGMLHNDVLFHPNSVNELHEKFDENPNQIFYIVKRKRDVLYFNEYQLSQIVNWMEPKLNITVDIQKIWDGDWVSESMAVGPVEVFTRFGKFLLDNQFEMEAMLANNKWGLMDHVKHRNCGFTERMWGIYLMSLGMPVNIDVRNSS